MSSNSGARAMRPRRVSTLRHSQRRKKSRPAQCNFGKTSASCNGRDPCVVGTSLPERRWKMNVINKISDTERYARCVQASKRVRWDVDEDVIRGRRFDAAHKFLPDGLSLAAAFTTLSAGEKRFVSQIQGRTYANVFGLVERFINAKVLELSRDHWFGDQVALEELVRFT